MIAGSAVGSSMCQTRLRQQIGDIGLDHDALVLASQLAGQARGDFGIVERGFAHAIFLRERDRVGAHGLRSRAMAAIMATMLEESRPALRKAPMGTSLTICASTEAQKRSRISSARSASSIERGSASGKR